MDRIHLVAVQSQWQPAVDDVLIAPERSRAPPVEYPGSYEVVDVAAAGEAWVQRDVRLGPEHAFVERSADEFVEPRVTNL